MCRGLTISAKLKFDVAEPDPLPRVVPRDYAIDDDELYGGDDFPHMSPLSILKEMILGGLVAILAIGLVIALAFFFAFTWRVLREVGIDVWQLLSDLAASAWRRFS